MQKNFFAPDQVNFNYVPYAILKELGVESWIEKSKILKDSLKNGGTTKLYKVYGAEGHRQRESFFASYSHDFSCGDKGIRFLSVYNSDKTGTNDYSIVKITRATSELCEAELL